MKYIINNVILSFILTFLVISESFNSSAASWADKGAYSIGWYKKDQSVFTISTPEELAGVAYLVNNNFTSFSGKKIYIDDNINLHGRTWIPIGISNTNFEGEIIGNGYSIYNLRISDAFDNKSGFFIKLTNAKISAIRFQGSVSNEALTMGLIAAQASNTEFYNLRVDNLIKFQKYEVSFSTSTYTKSDIGGIIGSSSQCMYLNVKCQSSFEFKWGTLDGSNCYGRIELNCGGLVGNSVKDNFEKCQSSNECDIIINGYVTNSSYSDPGDSFVTYGGIAGYCSGDRTSIISCLAENRCFSGQHPNGTYDIKNFRYGGIVAYMSIYSTLKNCVALNQTYNVEGHYSWQMGRDLTYSYFGGIGCEVSKNNYGGCFSNKDVEINTTHVKGHHLMENGSTYYTASEMNSAEFVDELNLYSQIEYDKDNWMLDDNGKLAIRLDPIDVASITIDRSEWSGHVGEEFTLNVTITPEDASDKTLEWKSSNDDVAIVDEFGLVTAVGEGTATITVTCGEASAQCEITVFDENGVESILATPNSSISIYSVDGVIIKKDANIEDLKTLVKGTYIIISENNRYKVSI